MTADTPSLPAAQEIAETKRRLEVMLDHMSILGAARFIGELDQLIALRIAEAFAERHLGGGRHRP